MQYDVQYQIATIIQRCHHKKHETELNAKLQSLLYINTCIPDALLLGFLDMSSKYETKFSMHSLSPNFPLDEFQELHIWWQLWLPF